MAKNFTEPRMNERIRVPEVRLIGEQGEQIGVVPTDHARELAREAGIDLVEVAERDLVLANPRGQQGRRRLAGERHGVTTQASGKSAAAIRRTPRSAEMRSGNGPMRTL